MILHLTIKKEWFNLISKGEKTEEYREIKDYYLKRLLKCEKRCIRKENCDGCPCISFKEFQSVMLHEGYNTRNNLELAIKEITTGKGKPEWGAEADRIYFIIKLGKKIQQNH